MNFSDIRHSMQLLWTRLKIEGSFLPTFPRFRATLTILLLVGLVALFMGPATGRTSDNQNLALVLSLIAWGGSFLISLLNNPLKRAKTFLSQIMSLVLAILLGLALVVSYQIIFVSDFPVSIQYAWLIGTILLAAITVRVLSASFGRFILSSEGRYPGLISSPVLFALLIINYLWWQWPMILGWLQAL